MKKYLRRLLPAFLALALLLPGAAFAQAQGRAYASAAYFDKGYSAFAFAREKETNAFDVDIYLQFVAGYPATDTIVRYSLYVNGTQMAQVPVAEASTGETAMPVYFHASVEINGAIESMHVTPVFENGGEQAAESVSFMPVLAEGSSVGKPAAVNNPDATDRLNLRLAPSGEGDSLRQYYNGTQVNILAEMSDDWLAVSIGKGGGMARGYMKKGFLAIGEAAAAVEVVTPRHEAEVASWTLYSFPDEGSAPVGTFGLGQAFSILGRSSAWWHIQVGEETGFVRADVLVAAPQAEGTDSAGETPPSGADGQAAEQPETSASTANGMRQYAAEGTIAGYEAKASVTETAQGSFDVHINLQFSPDAPQEDAIVKYALYINGQRTAEIPRDWSMHTTLGPAAGYRSVVDVEGTIETLVLKPVWEKAGEMQAQALQVYGQ